MLSEAICGSHLSSCRPRTQCQEESHNGGTQDYSYKKCVIPQGCLPLVWIFVPVASLCGSREISYCPCSRKEVRRCCYGALQCSEPSRRGLRDFFEGLLLPWATLGGPCSVQTAEVTEVSHTKSPSWQRLSLAQSPCGCLCFSCLHLHTSCRAMSWASQGSGAVSVHTCPLGSVSWHHHSQDRGCSQLVPTPTSPGWSWTFNLY